jgi:hypothetical protein
VSTRAMRSKGGAAALPALCLLSVCLYAAPAAAEEATLACEYRLVMHLTPDVPNPSDQSFLSSLVTDAAFQVTWREQSGGDTVVDLRGPGPGHRCNRVVEGMRRDGRVVSVEIQPK